MDPPGSGGEPAEIDHTLLRFDPDSLLNAWVDDLLAARDDSTRQDDQPVAMPSERASSNIDNTFGGSESFLATDFGPLDLFQISNVPRDDASGSGPPIIDLPDIDAFSMPEPSLLQQFSQMEFQFTAGGGHNPSTAATMQDLSLSPCVNSGDLHGAATNNSRSVAFPLQNPMPVGSGDFAPQTHPATAYNIERPEGQPANTPGASQNAAPSRFSPSSINKQGLRPNLRTKTKLARKRRGGRRGKLSAAQAQQQKETKLSGACIRCRKCRVGCDGRVPCGPCLKILGKSRIWTTPCTKAQFLDIIEVGSSIPSVTMQEIALFNPDIRTMMVLTAHMTTLSEKKENYYAVIESVNLGQTCAIPWWVGSSAMVSTFDDLSEDPSDWGRPSFAKVASKVAWFVAQCPSGELVKLFNNTEEIHTLEWATSVMAFCLSSSYRQPRQFAFDGAVFELPEDVLERLTSSLVSWISWVASRYLELCLFRYLQGVSNTHSFDSVEDQKSYIMCILTVLLAPDPYPQSIHDDSMGEEDPRTASLYRDAFDRRARVQSALWVYCSIAIRGLPSWSSIWETIRQRWPLVQGEAMAQKFHDSLTAFNASLRDNTRTALDSLYRLKDYSSLLSAMDPNSEEEDEDETDSEEEVGDEAEGEQTSHYKDDPEFYKLLLANGVDNLIESHDQEATGGVLSAQTSSQKQLASTRAFAALAIIDWRRKPVLYRALMGPLEGCLDLLESFVQEVLERLASMRAYDECAQQCPVGVPLDDFIRGDPADEATTQPMQNFNELVQCFIRSGRRWNELKDLVGLEVVLMHDPLRHFRADLSTFYIPSIVKNGSERRFTQLKELIPTRLPWLAETCVKLCGLVPMLTAASTTEHENASAIQDEIQKMVTTVFGTRSSVEEALLNSWAKQDDLQRGLIELFRPDAATIPFDMKVGVSLCLLDKLSKKFGKKVVDCVDFEMKEDVCRETESIMERDCSTLGSESRRELRVWSHKVLDFVRSRLPADTDSQASD